MSDDPADFSSRRPGVPWWWTDEEVEEMEREWRRREYGEEES